MKIRYYGYHLVNVASRERFRADLLPFLNKFCDYDDSEFKNSFNHNAERIFIIKAENPVFLFVKTKDTDIVKAIDKATISAHEIIERLQEDESIGFAAYFYVGPNYLAYGATQLAPTISALVKMINTILSRLGYESHALQLSPLASSISRDEALNMSFIGSSLIAVNQQSGIFDELKDVLGISEQAAQDIGTFEIRIRPVAKRNVKDAIEPLLRLEGQGMEKFEIRAKAELYDRIMDYRIERSLIESDELPKSAREDIITSIKAQVQDKANLNEKVIQYEQENDVQNSDVDDFIELHSNLDWGRLIHRDQVDR